MREKQALRLYKSSAYQKVNNNNAVLQRLVRIRKEAKDGSSFLDAAGAFLEKADKVKSRSEELKNLYDVAMSELFADAKVSIQKVIKKFGDFKMDQDVESLGSDKDLKSQKAKQKYMGTYTERDKDGKITKTGPKIGTKEKQTHVKSVWTIDVVKDGKAVGEINAKKLFDKSGKSVLKGDRGTILYKGMPKSEEVTTQIAAIQSRLAGLGFLSKDDVDGDYGPKTKTAVEKFQEKYKLSKDGKVGRQTITAMFSDTASSAAKDVPITGKSSNAIIDKTIDNLTKDRTKTTEYYEPIERELNLGDRKQRGLEESHVLDSHTLRKLIRESIRRKLI